MEGMNQIRNKMHEYNTIAVCHLTLKLIILTKSMLLPSLF